MPLKLIAISLMPLITVFVLAANSKTPFRMSLHVPEDDAGGLWARVAFTDIFRKLNYNLEVIHLPETRSYGEVMQGKVEGELARAESYGSTHPDLLRLKLPIGKIKLLAYSTVPLKGWEDLKNPSLRIDYKAGNPIAVEQLTKLPAQSRIQALRTEMQGFDKLVAGRSEVFIAYETSTTAIFKGKPEFARKVKHVTELEKFEVYTYLHPKHAELAPKLDRIIQSMATDGSIEKYRKEAEEKFTARAKENRR